MIERLPRGFRVTLIVLAAILATFYLTFGIITAQQTLGCDFLVYRGAALNLLGGHAIYDQSITQTGSCNLYYYPPPFLAIVVPFALLSPLAGTLAWIAALTACYVVGCLVMPVRSEVKLAIFMLGAVSWPFIFGVRIGQVVPILFLLFAIGWRRLDRPEIVGAAVALGTLIKLQPIVVLGWLIVRRMWRGVASTLVVGALLSLVAAVIGLGAWGDMVTVLRNLDTGIDQPVNFALGAIGYQHGLSLAGAGILQAIGTLAVLGLVVLWGVRGSLEAGFLVAVVASQVVSPIIWSHYALILLLPVAWLLQQRQWWAAIIPISQAWVLIPFMPNEIYPLAFYVLLLAVPVVDWRRRQRPTPVQLEGATGA
jgi:alpha-1,2-mannosyltransferase